MFVSPQIEVTMQFVHDDGGREAAGYKGSTGDCVCRSIAIATGLPYQEVYDGLNKAGARERKGSRKRGTSSSRTGVYKPTIRKYMASLGWTWTPTMLIGSGCKVHLVDGELPMGRLVVQVSRHLTAVIDGVIHDTHNPQRKTYWYHGDEVTHVSDRCVYGYWTK